MANRVQKLLCFAGTTLLLGAVAGMTPAGSPPAHEDPHDQPAAKAPQPASKPAAKGAEKPAGKSPAKKEDAHGDEGDAAGHGDGHDQDHGDVHDDAHADDHAPQAAKEKKVVEPRKSLFGDKAKEKPAAEGEETAITADAALAMLKEGNQRWVAGDAKNPSTDAARRQVTADKGQKPFATVLTCADSRVPVERIFDRGVGEVFSIRVAGNVAGDSETGTIEYGVGHLHTPLIVVMGHTKCGAVAAACSNAQLHGKVAMLVDHIHPAVERVKRASPDADDAQLATLAIKENVWQSIFDLYKNSDEIRNDAHEGKVRVVGAIYDIATGKVEWLGEHPWQSQILDALEVKTASVISDHE
ncbi:MAG TPA: carbonic anhydrase [Phycisphaerales bacterium]|nr:carbonic anhydrase [Phycisphaerales bacterium]